MRTKITNIGWLVLSIFIIFYASGCGDGGGGGGTTPGATTPFTSNATSVTDTSATLNGGLNNPSGYTTTVWIEYGTTASYGTSTTPVAYAQTGEINVSANLTGLQQSTTYHFRLVTQNTGGTFHGSDNTFATLATPQILASGLNSPHGIAVDSTSVYWTQGDAVMKVGINGGAATTLASGLNGGEGIAIDATSVYWTERGSGTVRKVGLGGGAVTTLASGLNDPFGITIDSTNVYWTEYGGGTVKKAGKDGGTVTTLASGLPGPSGVAVDSTSVYWTEGGTVKKVGISGGTVTILASISVYSYPSNIAVDSTSVYWTASGSGALGVSINGGWPSSIAGWGWPCNVLGIAVDSTSAYWTDSCGDNRVMKGGISVGAATTLASGLTIPYGIAIDSTSVYWTDINDGTVKKVPK